MKRQNNISRQNAGEHTAKKQSKGVKRSVLAQRYFPDSKGRLAVARMRRWILADPQMMADLQRVGYRWNVHTLSNDVVAVLNRYLG